MTRDEDRAMRSALARAGGAPVLARRDELLDVLVARIEAGGVDVASAPAPTAHMELVPGLPSHVRRASGEDFARTAPRRLRAGARIRAAARRAVGIGIAGWILVGVGTAAAAAIGTWLVLDPPGREAPPIETPAPSPSPSPSPSAILPSAVPSLAPDVVPDVTLVVPDLSGVVDELPVAGSLLDTVAPVISPVPVDRLMELLVR